MADRKLEPCPWCGPQEDENAPVDSMSADSPPLFFVQCWRCNAVGPECATAEEAADKWNGWVNACLPGIAERHVRCECGRILEAVVIAGDDPHLSVPVCERCLRDAVEQEMTALR